MGKRVILLGGIAAIVAACGGKVDSTSIFESAQDTTVDEGPRFVPGTPSAPEVIADGVGTPSALAMSPENVLFTTRTTKFGGEIVTAGALFVANKLLGPALMLAIDRQGASYDALATDGATAYVATNDGRVVSVPVMGGDAKTVASLAAPAAALAVHGKYVYFADDAGNVGRVVSAGGDAENVGRVEGAVRGIEVDEASVYVATGGGIVRIAIDGTETKVAAPSGETCAMIRDGRRLFWTSLSGTGTGEKEKGRGAVLSLSLDGGEVATVASGSFTACAIATDSANLYFVTTTPAAVPVRRGGAAGGLGLMRAPIAGGEPVAIAGASDALAQPGAVAADTKHVYWLTGTAVLRLRK